MRFHGFDRSDWPPARFEAHREFVTVDSDLCRLQPLAGAGSAGSIKPSTTRERRIHGQSSPEATATRAAKVEPAQHHPNRQE